MLSLLLISTAIGTVRAQMPPSPSEAGESYPPYFNFKARQFLIEGSYSITPLTPIEVGHGRQFKAKLYSFWFE